MNARCKINNLDAFAEWGVVLPDTSVSQLMAFAPLKPFVSNKTRLDDGTQVITTDAKVDERDLTLVFYVKASTQAQFNHRIDALGTVFRNGSFTLWIAERANDYYRLIYQSCSQFTQFNGRLAKFTLKVTEPDPTDRGSTPKERRWS